MKRILTLTLVGILLLPSLFACGAEAPQATVTAPDTAAPETAPSETPAVEIGESGSTIEGISLQVNEVIWTEDSAGFNLCINNQTNQPIHYRNQFQIQRLVGDTWEIFKNYNENRALYECLRSCLGAPEYFLRETLRVTDLFNEFENGTWRLLTEFSVTAEEELCEEVWVEFTVSGMRPEGEKKRKEIGFSVKRFGYGWILEDYTVPTLKVFRSATELKDFFKHLETMPEALACYDETYFKDHVLVAISLWGGGSSVRHFVDSVKYESNGELYIAVNRAAPQLTSDDISVWQVVLEFDAGVTVEDEKNVTLYLYGNKVNPTQISN